MQLFSFAREFEMTFQSLLNCLFRDADIPNLLIAWVAQSVNRIARSYFSDIRICSGLSWAKRNKSGAHEKSGPQFKAGRFGNRMNGINPRDSVKIP